MKGPDAAKEYETASGLNRLRRKTIPVDREAPFVGNNLFLLAKRLEGGRDGHAAVELGDVVGRLFILVVLRGIANRA